MAALLETIPNSIKLQLQSHVIQSPDCLSFVSDLRAHRICMRKLQTSNSCISTPTEKWTHVYMNLFTPNSPYYHLLKYLLFLRKHPVYCIVWTARCNKLLPHCSVEKMAWNILLMYWSIVLTYEGINVVYFCKQGDEFFLHKGQGISVPDEKMSPSEGAAAWGRFLSWLTGTHRRKVSV